MTLTVLGSATPYPRPDQPCSGYLLQHDATSIWVDAGTGTLAELQRHIPLADLSAIWISHSHADHSADLLTTYYALRFSELRPARPVPLFCPPALIERLGAFLGPKAPGLLPEVFEIHEFDGWGGETVGSLELEWGPMDHGLPAYGLRATADGASIAYSGDTAPCQGLVELAEGADLLLAEAGYDTIPSDQPAVHLTPEDAGRAATEARVKRLLLTHIGEALEPAAAVERAGALFGGGVFAAKPGDIHTVG
jgi:ribonuclease BN (tRNA processing enzyme)